LGKSLIVNTLQRARLDEWIGDFSNAEKLLSEIEESNSDISYLLRKTVKERKKKLETEEKYQIAAERAYKEPKPMLFNIENLQIGKMSDTSTDYNTPISFWKYSATVISKVDSDLRVEIRGYNPQGIPPRLKFEVPSQIQNWAITDVSYKPNNDQISLLNIFTTSEEPNVQMYFSVDRWGLLSGVAILNENDIGIALKRIDFLYSIISSKIWPAVLSDR
jgi:hypothetical protein